jgi:imidazole glycerol-phosphate synthase subunit HisH
VITIVDYGLGNLGSVRNMLKRIGVPATITGDLDTIAKAEKLLLPGVGAFDNAMERIDSSGLRPVLDHKAMVERIPVLGICLGMQLLMHSSEEGERPGLGWIAGGAYRFPAEGSLKVPHMGWNLVEVAGDSPLTRDLPEESRFYFVHSYYVRADDEKHAVLKARHGVPFDAALQRDNIFGAQFHPEKSHRFGMKLLENFARI